MQMFPYQAGCLYLHAKAYQQKSWAYFRPALNYFEEVIFLYCMNLTLKELVTDNGKSIKIERLGFILSRNNMENPF